MQLDKTEISIRQRSTPELLDLSLLVIRRYWRPLLISSALVGLPLLAVNVLLTSWMIGEQGRFSMGDLENPDWAMQQRYLMHLFALWYLEFPLASLPATVLLGNYIFFEQLSFRRLLSQLRPVILPAVFVLGVLRMGLVGLPLELLVDRMTGFEPFIELVVLVFFCCGVATFRRSTHPFAPEILGLEGCRLRAKSKNELTYWRRSSSLHGPILGDCMGRFLTCAVVASGLVVVLYSQIFVIDYVGLRHTKLQFFNALLSGQMLVQVALPLAMWLGGIYATVFRFLSYLDARIRLEGWEVELQLKAERARLLQAFDETPHEVPPVESLAEVTVP